MKKFIKTRANLYIQSQNTYIQAKYTYMQSEYIYTKIEYRKKNRCSAILDRFHPFFRVLEELFRELNNNRALDKSTKNPYTVGIEVSQCKRSNPKLKHTDKVLVNG
ncbi:hypothetical protein SAMN02745171_01028 [Porphyromonas circumdentaria]|uniref:Uncharacterized protein n=1 Tax=Porphyromonas circumdentaria TaxID=29524 RepID=A0A1T4N811_9PORP|nr:hypothetical protein [Porphyromonas circumdentaria]SJZ75187.1 hypothetical protein SAMN02745171_01028 [Porphyromonas circumdentaria]